MSQIWVNYGSDMVQIWVKSWPNMAKIFLKYYENINACGLKNYSSTSLENLNINISNKEFDMIFKKNFIKELSKI